MDLESKILAIVNNRAEGLFGVKMTGLFSLAETPNREVGDLALSCFLVAQTLKISPVEVATRLSVELAKDEFFISAKNFGPYINLIINNDSLFTAVLKVKNKLKFDRSKVILEYLSPNTNKPLHLGHVRNGSLGMAISNSLEAVGAKLKRVSLINDRGIHICKSLIAWEKFGNGETPETAKIKGDHLVGKYYVEFAKRSETDPQLIVEASEALKKWEAGDPAILATWKKLNAWVYAGWAETYKTFGFVFSKFDYESKTYKLGKDIVEAGLKRGVFTKGPEGAITFTLPDKFGKEENGGLKKVTLLRADGTSVYITQDLGTATRRFESEGQPDKMLYVVGSEQVYHFQCLKEILKALGSPAGNKIKHLSYGMVTLPDGKMKSREGKVVDADDLATEMITLAKTVINEKHAEKNLNRGEIERRAKIIGLGAIKFYILRFGAGSDIRFNPEESIAFEGVTGPYIQYTYARIQSIAKKAGYCKRFLVKDLAEPKVLGANLEERDLALKLLAYPEKLKAAAENFDPALLANYLYELAKIFNHFYHCQSIISAGSNKLLRGRLALALKAAEILKAGLGVLGIETLKEM